MLQTRPYTPLDSQTVASRVGALPGMTARLGPSDRWRVKEVGDGNLNLVFIIEGPSGFAVAKQALPYARCVGDAWPMSLDRAYFEYNALIRLGARDPQRLPEVYAFDEGQALVVMEYLHPHIILRKALVEGEYLPYLARDTGRYLARTLFRGSDLAMETSGRKADLALFAHNVELCGITEDLVFTDPFHRSPRNRHTTGLERDAERVRGDRALKLAAFDLKMHFATAAETLLHGDFHTGSVMVTPDDTRVIDAEFAFYGPMGFDLGCYLGNLLLAFFAQSGLRGGGTDRSAYAAWILGTIEGTWREFATEFAVLWRTERNGMLGVPELFEDASDGKGADMALEAVLAGIWRDTVGFAGIEMHRRILGLAHAAEIEAIENESVRSACERRALAAARAMMIHRDVFSPATLPSHVASVSRG
ncbi:S-methyl-5-thioribose kinase [Marinivivus vitaminiproducens]|uniref:S-methyl-5-thioribose kinase n=1 Tax=Marinivivus vitaminiproducens TaxID=3035935 RepID=UPI0027A79269|nr:S-methyl-5-thioribose kinase [Geminicoccaceae bacterium SCSIO 64248]